MCFSAQAQISNGGFENWKKILLFEHPASTTTSMSSNYETFFDNGLLNVNQIVENENSVLRIENIMGSESVQPGYFIFGKIPSGEMVFGAGNSISMVDMTGISMDLKYDLANESEGFVMVQFKDGNTPVGTGNYGTGTYFFPITGSQDWSNVEFVFDNPIDPTANTCVIAIASGDVLNSDTPFAEGSFVEVDNLEFMESEQTIPGGDFETWTMVEPIYAPEDCYVDLDPFDATYQKSYDEFSGSYALRLHSALRDDNVDVGYMLMGNKSDEGEITPNIEIGDKSLLSFRYFYLGENDLAEATVVFYKEVDGDFESVHEHVLELGSNENYELLEYPFQDDLVQLGIDASHMTIEFKSSMDSPEMPAQDGSILLLDEVALESALGINSMLTAQSVKQVWAYPNPTLARVIFNFGAKRAGYFRVFNQGGVQVAIREFSGTNELIFDLGPYPAGQYLFKFYHNAGFDTARVIKN